MYTAVWTGFVTILQSEQFKKWKIHTEAPLLTRPLNLTLQTQITQKRMNISYKWVISEYQWDFLYIHASYFLSFKRN